MATSEPKASIWTPANIVTCIRMVFVPAWLLVAELAWPSPRGTEFCMPLLLSCIFYVVLSLTDKLDGYLARSRGEVTTFGKFLDPIADKLIVVMGLCYLLEHGVVSSWVLLIVVLREFAVSGLRMVVSSKGVVVAASNLGKAKTATTMIAICGLLLVVSFAAGRMTSMLKLCFNVILWVAMALTLYSGYDYLVKCWKYVTE